MIVLTEAQAFVIALFFIWVGYNYGLYRAEEKIAEALEKKLKETKLD